MVARPFYWDKTAHGIEDAPAPDPSATAIRIAPQPHVVHRPALADPIGG
jgi:hypothetical protein